MGIQKKFLFLCVVCSAALMFCACSKRSVGSGIVQNRMGSGASVKTEQIVQAEDETEIQEVLDGELYILTKLDTERKTAAFQKVTSGRQLQYGFDTGTRFLNKYGDSRAAESFLAGDVVELEVSDSTQKLLSVQMSDQVWVYEDIVNYSVDESIHAFIIGQTKYSYDPGMDIFSGEETVGFANLGESDVLRAVGIDNELISLSVSKGHGYLALANTKLFEGSLICVSSWAVRPM